MDALPIPEAGENLAQKRTCISENKGTYHACGHDAHTAMLLGTLRILADNREKLTGVVYACFESGEETGYGVGDMIEALKQFRIDTCFALHVYSELESGRICVEPGARMAGTSVIDLLIKGRGGHGSRPDLAANPVFCAAAMLNNLAAAWPNRLDPYEMVTLGITRIQGGESCNIIPETARVGGTLRFFKEFRVPDIFCFMALLFYGLSPVVQLFAVSTTKDVLFSAVLLLFFMSLIRLYCRREAFFLSRRQLALFGGYAFAAMILRNNGLYIVTVMFVIVLWNCRKYWRKLLPVVTLVCVAYGIYTGPFYQLLHVTPGGIEEMLSVPLQQMARVYKYDRDSLEEEDVELLCLVVPEEYLDLYRPTVSDFVKRGFQEEVFLEHKKEFMDLWIRWGMEHPLTYVNSLLINTVDFWYPGAVVDGYRHGDGRSSYFDYKVDEPGKEIGLLPSVHDYYEAISHDSDVQKKPFAFLVLSPGWYLVMTMTAFGYLWCRKRNRLLIGGALSAVTMLTVLPGPMALVRYVLILYYAFPAVLVLFLMPELFTDAESSTGSELYTGSGQ